MFSDTEMRPGDIAGHQTRATGGGPFLWLALIGALFIGGLAVTRPELAIAIALVSFAGSLAFLRPHLSVYAFVFLLYTNLVAIAVSHHGVPRMVGVIFPLMLCVPLAYSVLVERKRLVITPILALLVVFLIIQSISSIFAANPNSSWNALRNYIFEGLVLYFLLTNTIRSVTVLRGAVWALVLAGGFASIAPLHQQVTRSFKDDYAGLAQVDGFGFYSGERRQPRLAGPVGEKNRFSQNMLMVLPIGLFLIGHERSRRLKALAALCTGLAAIGFVLAFSRGGALGLAGVLVAAVFLRAVNLRQLAVVGVGGLLLLAAIPQYWTRLATIGSAGNLFARDVTSEEAPDGAIRGRATEMLAAARVFLDHPILGVGPGMFGKYVAEYGNEGGFRRLHEGRRAHSLYLEIAAESGALGLGAFLAMIFSAVAALDGARRRAVLRNSAISGYATALLLALISYLATGMFLHLAYHRFFFIVLALAGATAFIVDREGQERAEVAL